jgi:hypothetical protein
VSNIGPQIVVQRLATGLPDVLGAKATGDTPHVMSEAMSSVIDVLPFLLCGRYQNTFVSTGNIVGQTVVFGPQVPPGEAWVTHNITSSGGPVTAGATITLGIGVYRNQTSLEALPERATFIAGELCYLGHWFEAPIIMMPGDRPVAFVSAFTGAPNFSILLSAGYVRVLV